MKFDELYKEIVESTSKAPKGDSYDSQNNWKPSGVDSHSDGSGGRYRRTRPNKPGRSKATHGGRGVEDAETMGSAMRGLDKISGEQEADKLYGAIHAEVEGGKSVEEVLKDMNYPEQNHKAMSISYKNWLASKGEGGEDAEGVEGQSLADDFMEFASLVSAAEQGQEVDIDQLRIELNALDERLEALKSEESEETFDQLYDRYVTTNKEDAESEEQPGDDFFEALDDVLMVTGTENAHAVVGGMEVKLGRKLSPLETEHCHEMIQDDELPEDGEGKEEPAEDAERVDKDRMKCNSPKRGGSKKFIVKACENGKEKVVRFGDPNMKIRKSNPKARKSFRARHKCDQKKDKFSAGYWSCKKW